jgi:hypothetical protein
VFINRITANTTNPVSEFWLAKTLRLSAQAIRVDRILDEVHATAGGVRRLCDLFGLSVGAALRYASTLDPRGVGETGPHVATPLRPRRAAVISARHPPPPSS